MEMMSNRALIGLCLVVLLGCGGGGGGVELPTLSEQSATVDGTPISILAWEGIAPKLEDAPAAARMHWKSAVSWTLGKGLAPNRVSVSVLPSAVPAIDDASVLSYRDMLGVSSHDLREIPGGVFLYTHSDTGGRVMMWRTLANKTFLCVVDYDPEGLENKFPTSGKDWIESICLSLKEPSRAD